MNQQNLKKIWETSRRSTKDDWQEWIRRFSVELLKESSSHALRACAALASVYTPLAKELFNAAFVSCWTELYDQFQDELVRSLETVLTSTSTPPEIVQTILNLAEFLEHDDKALPIDIKTLGALANRSHAYAKALHYKETEFVVSPEAHVVESLISINNQLQQPDAAIGILAYAQSRHEFELKESWYEKLHRWDEALASYNRKIAEDSSSIEAKLGAMRCLHALGEWDELSLLCEEQWKSGDADIKTSIAPLATAAAWGLSQWQEMEKFVEAIRADSIDGAFFRAILSLHRNQYNEALSFIAETRDLLDTELTSLIGESYDRAYK